MVSYAAKHMNEDDAATDLRSAADVTDCLCCLFPHIDLGRHAQTPSESQHRRLFAGDASMGIGSQQQVESSTWPI